MKKTVITSALTIGLLAASQLATADGLTFCPLLTAFTNLPVTHVSLVNYEENLYTVSTATVDSNNQLHSWRNDGAYTYGYYFSISGIKANSPLDAVTQFKTALNEAAATQPKAVSIEPKLYENLGCQYNIKTLPNAHAVAYISGTDTENLYVLPKTIDIQKLR